MKITARNEVLNSLGEYVKKDYEDNYKKKGCRCFEMRNGALCDRCMHPGNPSNIKNISGLWKHAEDTNDFSNFTHETDPHGLRPDQPGAKLDMGKPMAAQILGQFAHALWEVSKVGTFGARKYSIGGWQEVENGEARYGDAGMRHFLKKMMGENMDSDSGLLHLSQEAWNALAKLELHIRGLKSKGEYQL